MSDIARDTLLSELLALRPVLERKGITHVALFGSRARRDNRADSDIDLLVDIDDARAFSLLDLVGIAHDVEDRIGLPANLFARRTLTPSSLPRCAASRSRCSDG
jgi:predicted nucleotidyltransferase